MYGQGYPPQQGGYPPQQGGYPPQQGAYPPQTQPSYPPQQGGYPPQQGGYPPQTQPTNPPQQGGYPPQQPCYPPQQPNYPPQQPNYPPPQGNYPPPQPGNYPPSPGTVPPLGREPVYRQIRIGQGIDMREYDNIVGCVKAVYMGGRQPMASEMAEAIRRTIGGDWFVFISDLGIEDYDFSMTRVKGGDFIAFSLDNKKFQVLRIR